MRQPWLIDEVAHAGAEHLDPACVVAYDRKAGFDPTNDLVVLRNHGLGKTSTLLDLGAGTGLFALAAAERVGSRRRGRCVPGDAGRPPGARHRTGPLQSRVRPRRVPQLRAHGIARRRRIHTRNALHHLPDFWKAIALGRIAQMLKPRGILRVRDLNYDFQPSDANIVLDGWLGGAVEDPAAVTRARRSSSTSAAGTAPSDGCSSRC